MKHKIMNNQWKGSLVFYVFLCEVLLSLSLLTLLLHKICTYNMDNEDKHSTVHTNVDIVTLVNNLSNNIFEYLIIY